MQELALRRQAAALPEPQAHPIAAERRRAQRSEPEPLVSSSSDCLPEQHHYRLRPAAPRALRTPDGLGSTSLPALISAYSGSPGSTTWAMMFLSA